MSLSIVVLATLLPTLGRYVFSRLKNPRFKIWVISRLGSRGARYHPVLAEFLTSNKSQERLWAARALSVVGSNAPSLFPLVLGLVWKSPHPSLRKPDVVFFGKCLAQYLSAFDRQELFEHFDNFTRSDYVAVRVLAAKMLLEIKLGESLQKEPISRLLSDPSVEVRKQTALSLKLIEIAGVFCEDIVLKAYKAECAAVVSNSAVQTSGPNPHPVYAGGYSFRAPTEHEETASMLLEGLLKHGKQSMNYLGDALLTSISWTSATNGHFFRRGKNSYASGVSLRFSSEVYQLINRIFKTERRVPLVMFEQITMLLREESLQAKLYALEMSHQLFVELRLDYDRSNVQIIPLKDEMIGEFQLLLFLTPDDGVRQITSELVALLS